MAAMIITAMVMPILMNTFFLFLSIQCSRFHYYFTGIQPTKLTPELVHEFIEKIVIHEPRHLDGKRYQLMDIYYNGVGVIRGLTPEEMEEAFQEHLIKRKHNKVKTA